ncbi:hypothetical protein [Campylobacter pinnipediorum]|nr:hypothetical protein [Campylobacter pinnipediorum]
MLRIVKKVKQKNKCKINHAVCFIYGFVCKHRFARRFNFFKEEI